MMDIFQYLIHRHCVHLCADVFQIQDVKEHAIEVQQFLKKMQAKKFLLARLLRMVNLTCV